MTKAEFKNIRFGEAEIEDMKTLCKHLGLEYDARGVRSEVVRYALRATARDFEQGALQAKLAIQLQAMVWAADGHVEMKPVLQEAKELLEAVKE